MSRMEQMVQDIKAKVEAKMGRTPNTPRSQEGQYGC